MANVSPLWESHNFDDLAHVSWDRPVQNRLCAPSRIGRLGSTVDDLLEDGPS